MNRRARATNSLNLGGSAMAARVARWLPPLSRTNACHHVADMAESSTSRDETFRLDDGGDSRDRRSGGHDSHVAHHQPPARAGPGNGAAGAGDRSVSDTR